MLDSQYNRIVLGKFGGQANFARLTGIPQTTVSFWRVSGLIPQRRHIQILSAARKAGIELEPTEFLTTELTPRRRKRSAA